MFETELKELGLTENESKIYVALLQHGILNPTNLAEKTGLHRSYVYDTVERLLDRGIVNTVLVKNKKHYQAVDPKILREIFELKLRKLDSFLPQLSALFEEKKEATRVELHKGKYVYRTLIKEIVADIKKDDIVYLIGVDEALLETVEPIYLKQYFTILKEKCASEKVIIAKDSKRIDEPMVEYKELDPQYLDETNIVIHGSKVFLFILGAPYHLIKIESEKVANTYRKQFELMWGLSK